MNDKSPTINTTASQFACQVASIERMRNDLISMKCDPLIWILLSQVFVVRLKMCPASCNVGLDRPEACFATQRSQSFLKLIIGSSFRDCHFACPSNFRISDSPQDDESE
jgi:hypothetical protein